MRTLRREDLYSLEQYAETRKDFRARVLAHKKRRKVALGGHATLYFEDRLTIQYQIQEMLRIERIFEKSGIEQELSAYNPLIPDGNNLKATFMLEYDDVEDRRRALARLIDIEDRVWVRVGDGERIFAIADEDLDRENDGKTSAVHFVRFELRPEDVKAAKAEATIAIGVDHQNYRHEIGAVEDEVRAALVADLD